MKYLLTIGTIILIILMPSCAHNMAKPQIPASFFAKSLITYEEGSGVVYAVVFSKTMDMLEEISGFYLEAGMTELLLCDLNKELYYTLERDGVPTDPLTLIPIGPDSDEAYAQLSLNNAQEAWITITVTILKKGDFDRDGDVDHIDLFEFVFLWGVTCDDPEYNPIGDYNNDCFIHYLDLFDFVFDYYDPEYSFDKAFYTAWDAKVKGKLKQLIKKEKKRNRIWKKPKKKRIK